LTVRRRDAAFDSRQIEEGGRALSVADEQPAVYLAGPLGFTPYGLEYHGKVMTALRAAGLSPLDPWTIPDDPFAVAAELPAGAQRLAAFADANRVAGARNEQLIRASAGVLALLDGADVDSGTAAEIGFAAALRIPVVGLRLDLRPAGDNEATVVNLQVVHFIEASGGCIVRVLAEAVDAIVARLRPA
jgi:nucleoside 2-deoxyribosyltransferase